MGEAGAAWCAEAHVRGYGGTGARQGGQASLGSGTDGQEGGLQQSWLMLAGQKLPVYKHGIHRCLQLAQPKRKDKATT